MAYQFPALTGLSYGGTHSDSMSLLVREYDVPVLPPIDEETEVIPGMDGEWSFGVRYEPKIIPVTVRMLGATSKTDYNNKLRALGKYFNPRLGDRKLIFDAEPDKMYNAKLSSHFDLVRMGLISKDFTITFVCRDPFTYSTVEEDKSGATQVTCTQDGTHVASPTVIITKNAGAGTVTNDRSDGATEQIIFSSGSPAGTYTINSKEKTSLLGANGAYKYLDQEKYFQFTEGDNIVKTSSNSITNIQVKYRHTWL